MPNQAYWYRFEARDEEGQDIIWTITGPDAADFVIDEDSAFVMTAAADESAIARWNIVPDFENPMGSSTDVGAQGYVFTVNASDGTNIATHSVFIRIFDVNEQPEFTGTPTATDQPGRTRRYPRTQIPRSLPTLSRLSRRIPGATRRVGSGGHSRARTRGTSRSTAAATSPLKRRPASKTPRTPAGTTSTTSTSL